MMIEFSDGTKAVLRCTDEEFDRAVTVAKNNIFQVTVSVLYCGKIRHLRVLDIEEKRKEAWLKKTGTIRLPAITGQSIPPPPDMKEGK